MLPTPGFHHLHLNSVDPDAAIDWYTRQFPSCTKGEWAGFPALLSPNNVMVLFTKVDRPPTSEPQSAIWHFGWHVTDVRKTLATFKQRDEVRLLPLYTTDEGGSVLVSSDTWPNVGGVLGLTRAQIAEARAAGMKPPGGGGFAYMAGPDNALVEYAGNYPAERFNHVHLWHEEPLCALIWYQKHLNAPVRAGFGPAPSEADCKVPRGEDRTWPALNREGMFRVAARRRRVRRCGADLVREPGRYTAGQSARAVAGPHRAECCRSGCVAGEAMRRGGGGAGGAVSARCDARGDDRGAEQGGAGVGRGAVANNNNRGALCGRISSSRPKTA